MLQAPPSLRRLLFTVRRSLAVSYLTSCLLVTWQVSIQVTVPHALKYYGCLQRLHKQCRSLACNVLLSLPLRSRLVAVRHNIPIEICASWT